MSGINTVSGLKNVSIDYRPQVGPDAANATGAQQQAPDEIAGQGDNIINTGAYPQADKAKSIVRQLDTLLLNAAGKSVSADAAEKVKSVGETLVKNGVITAKESARLESLAKKASEKLAALDDFSGRKLAKALMNKGGQLVWSTGFFGGTTREATAVKAAVEAQERLSEALAEFNAVLAASDKVDVALQEDFMELQFQCDRRATEIYSVVVRMHDIVQKDAVDGLINDDPKIMEYLGATFKELMPREAVMMHGTAEALETMKAKFADQMRPLADKLDAFASDGTKTLTDAEVAEIDASIATMRNAIANVRKNGLEVNGSTTEVDKSILAEMDKVLDAARTKVVGLKKWCVERSRTRFVNEVRANFSFDRLTDAAKVMREKGGKNAVITQFRRAADDMVALLGEFAEGKRPMAEFDAAFEACRAKFPAALALRDAMKAAGFVEREAKKAGKKVEALGVLAAQFKELMRTGERLLEDDEDSMASAEDVRKMMLGERRLSAYIDAKAHGFGPDDVDPATDPTNIVKSKQLGSGAAGTTYLLTTRSGKEFVFKPELEGRIGLNGLSIGSGGAYSESQKTVNLNLATQQAAKVFGCEDIVVKYSVGCYKGQFGFFMERAKGFSAAEYTKKQAEGKDGIEPCDLKLAVPNPVEQLRIKGDIARKLNRLSWLDVVTGQGDRHWNNYFVNVGKKNHSVTVKAIDNDASFSAIRTGVQRYVIPVSRNERFQKELMTICKSFHGKNDAQARADQIMKDPGLQVDPKTNAIIIDLSKSKSLELELVVGRVIGARVTALPEEIDRSFYNVLMEMDENPAKKKAYLDSIAPRISQEALKAAEQRLDDAIAHAKKLNAKGRVFDEGDWTDERKLSGLTNTKTKLKFVKLDGTTKIVKPNIKGVKDYLETSTPSLYKRDKFDKMFE